MTVDTSNRKIKYMGDGTTTEFTIPFPFFRADSIKAQIKKKDFPVTPFTDFDISGINDDGKIGIYAITGKPIPNGAEIMFYRETSLTQETDYKENANLSSETLERDFDNCVMQTQELSEELGRCLKLDMFDSRDSDITKVLNACDEAVAAKDETLQLKEDVLNAGAIQLNRVKNEGNTQAGRIQSAGNTEFTRVQSEGDTQFNRVNSKGIALISDMRTEGSVQVMAATTQAERATEQANIALTQAGVATTKAGEAVGSAIEAETFATNASNSATAANVSATNAGASETNAAGSASTASTKAGEAQASAASAAGSSQTATTKAGEAASSAIEANTSAINAESSAIKASDSAGTATNEANRSKTEADRAAEIASSIGNPANRDLSNLTAAGVTKIVPPQSPATVGQVLQSTADGAVWGASSNFILLSAYVSNMELTGTDAAGWALSGSMVEGQNAVTALPVLTRVYNEGVSYGTGTIYATITGLKRAITLKKGLLIAPYSEANVNALNALWDAGKEANVWLLDTVNQRFMCPRTRNWTANTTGVNDFIEESLPNITGRAFPVAAQTVLTNITYGSGAFDETKTSGVAGANSGGSGQPEVSFRFNANRSSSAYKDGATVQQNASTVYIYYRIYDGIKPSEDIVVEDLTQILTDVQSLENTKLDKDLSNLPQVSKEAIIRWGDYKFNTSNKIAVNYPFTAPKNGCIVGELGRSGGVVPVSINGVSLGNSPSGTTTVMFFPVNKNDVVAASGATVNLTVFIPQNGSL